MTLRNYIAGPLLAVSMSACSTLGGIDPATITAIQNAATSACGFLPTVSVVLALLGTNNPSLQTAQQIAAAICNAVVPPASVAARGAAPRGTPTVAGVVIDGKFVR